MGKGNRKNPGVGVDFRKVKHKVGKKLPKAQNDTRTDFQSRSINLPNQSVTQDKAGAAVSERNLTLKELVGQLSHHNTHTRRDALTGLQQLLTAHPAEARRHAALLLEALATRVSDGEPSVRSALLALLRAAALPAVGPVALSPFMPMFMAHLSAALTHLSADVRLDALAVLEALTDAAPQLLAADNNLCAALAHYTGLLSRSNRGKSVKSQALSGLLKVLSSLERFLAAAMGATGGNSAAARTGEDSSAAGVMDSSSSSGGSSCIGPLMGFRAVGLAPPAAARLPTAAEVLKLYTNTGSSSNSSSNGSGSGRSPQQQLWPGSAADAATASVGGAGSAAAQLQQQSLALLSVLLDCWSEAAPASLSTAPELESAQVLVHILACSQLLLKHSSPKLGAGTSEGQAAAEAAEAAAAGAQVLCPGFNTSREQAAWLNQAAAVVLPKLLKVFPVVAPAANVSGQVQDLLQRFNLLAVQLQAGFMAAGVLWPPGSGGSAAVAGFGVEGVMQGRKGGSSSSSNKALLAAHAGWQERLLGFMADVLITGSCLPASTLSTTVQPDLAAAAAGGSKGSNTPGDSSKKQRQATGGASGSSSSSNSSSSSLLVVLQCLQLLLPQLPPQPRQRLLAAVGELVAHKPTAAAAAGSGGKQQAAGAAAAAAPTAAVRSTCLQLQLQLMLRYLYDATPDPVQESAVAGWIAAAPKLLWECGTARPQVSRLLLCMIYHAGRLSQPGSLVQQQLQQIQPQLAALLATALPGAASSGAGAAAAAGKPASKKRKHQEGAAAAAAAAGQQVLVGPLAGLPAATQALAFDAISFLPQLQQPLLKAIALSCRITPYADVAVQRLLEATLSTAATSLPPDHFLSFVATLLGPLLSGRGYVDRANGGSISGGFSRHKLLVDAACSWLHSYGPLQELLQLLVPVTVQQWQQQQREGSAGASSSLGLRCSSYSCASLAALAVGCWRPSSSSSSNSNVGSSMLAACAGEELIPQPLLDVLPAVLTSYCTSTIAAEGSAAAAVTTVADGAAAAATAIHAAAAQAVPLTAAGLSGSDAGSQDVAAVDTCMPLVLPLLTSTPQLILPFLEQLLQHCAGSGAAAGDDVDAAAAADGVKGAAVTSDSLAVAIHVMNVVLSQQGLKGHLIQQEQQLQQLVGQLVAAGRQLQQASGDAAALLEAQQLQTAVALLFGH